MADPSVLNITIGRDGKCQLWGFRIRGGSDLGEPLIVQRVAAGSPSDGELRPGDAFLKINGHDTASLSHDQAHDLIKSAGNTISLLVQRAGGQGTNKKPMLGLSATLPRQKSSTVSGMGHSHRISDIMASPIENLPVTVFPPNEILARQEELLHAEMMEREKERVAVTHQPYRTTPLVLPGAKVKRDAATPQSYLRLQQNANLWSAGNQPAAGNTHPSLETVNNTLLKKKLEAAAAMMQSSAATTAAAEGPADTPSQFQVVHKQFNSPMSLYSKENIEQTLSAQTGILTSHNAAHARAFNPRESETYRALMDAENKAPINKPAIRDFKPAQSETNNAIHAVPFKVNVMGSTQDKIQQSYSFKRIMADVLGETDF